MSLPCGVRATSGIFRGSLGLRPGELLGYELAESLGVAIGVVAAAVGDAAWLLAVAG